jgi:hypothetical protein
MSILKGYGEYPCAIKKFARDMPEKGIRGGSFSRSVLKSLNWSAIRRHGLVQG